MIAVGDARERAALTGVDTAVYRQCRRVTVSVDVLQQQTSLTPEESNEIVGCLVVRGPGIDMSTGGELRAGPEALDGAVQALAAAGLRDSHVERLREVIGRRCNAFWSGLRRGDPLARVEPLRVALEPGVRPVKARPRVYNPIKTARLAACMPSLAVLGIFSSIFSPCGECCYDDAKKRGVSHGERLLGCQPASRKYTGCDAQSRSEHGQDELG